MTRTHAHRVTWLICGILLLALLCVASVAFGARTVGLSDLLAGVQGDASSVDSAAVVKRLPRTALAVLVGAALALSGAAMQAITRNPLAEPGILGVSSGAALAVVAGLSFFGLHRPFTLMAVAIGGAACAAITVYLIGGLGSRGRSPFALALAGAACGAAFISLTNAIMLPRVDLLRTYQFWRIGSVGGASWESVGVLIPLFIAGVVLCALLARGMNALALGDDVATGLGESVGRTRALVGVAAVVLCGAATAVAGPIGFVGLLVPHVCRTLFGPDHRWLLPFSALAGAMLLLGADVLGRVITRPAEIEVGILTAILGAPFLIWIVRRTRVGAL
ncbi:iron complex transport system permease protein [Leucobacter luti]|uniref:Iron complex transport system permease protein n=1 Tax=Leucobacter luti TaxID=340320 RepID=A0A4R6RVM4_9MICO|nr:iron ABC transporter permease [Leucobacter luti]MCW2287896.1 iron complex transport system permease protein [Leucobacter luti]TCK45941.1 iron complex transport system permease protein [Leucobacter luti]TDP90166.1 iron complex transport system permease protein [Leucobacter luti]